MTPDLIHLIRHGETDWNAAGRWQGVLPVPLNECGRTQAHKLADHLRRRPIAHIYASDLPRAYETGEILARALGAPISGDPRWREINLGIFQGWTRAEIADLYPVEFTGFTDDYFGYVVPEGESRWQVQARAYAAWQATLAAAAGPEVAVVSHGNAIRMLLLKLFPDQVDTLRKTKLGNTSVTTLRRAGRGWEIDALASTVHLEIEILPAVLTNGEANA